ncbi:hypothetical protein SAMN05443287_102695 [Micromonospora phaseoli]|uniref:Uncharacterized protein n=1 Tax=Micromonospora phaseoli TaxID=1144548 RepID=A0A1H6VHG9_9ACTN|nr:hypothetical protein [Micromonospora phaseoli]PZV93552.1 hypothetical protein CLV64_10911 [Micromonospora phaseoli]GIJ80182.1 hypothetical protein Xph01_46140 [Micromonospora phaseoli]SEJ04051.1 hypothetical protein SAMN05443287_102695 [Micromonospora phaseoli]
MTIVSPASIGHHRTRRPPPDTRLLLREAPLSEHGIVEAALAWRQLRPTTFRSPLQTGSPVRQPHLPLAQTDHEPVASRLARALTGFTWAVVAESGDGGSPRFSVTVPRNDYHRVLRALTVVWRGCRRDFAPGTGQGSPGAAVALWRMALLLHPVRPGERAVQVRTTVPFAAEMLCEAAAVLRIDTSHQRTGAAHAVVIRDLRGVHRLLTLTGTPDRPATVGAARRSEWPAVLGVGR